MEGVEERRVWVAEHRDGGGRLSFFLTRGHLLILLISLCLKV